MALSKVNFNSLNVTPAASKAIKFNSNNNGIETGDVGGSMVLLETQTASSSGTLSFTSNINSTYKEYIFKFIDIHPQTDDKDFQFNLSVDSGSNYNVTKTDTAFRAYHTEDGSGSGVGYQSSMDLAQSTNFANMCSGLGNGNDESLSGFLHLFDPSNTTFVKHYITRTISYHGGDLALDHYTAGYGNTTSAVDAIQFKMSSGNIDAGTIKLYGVS
jgi:hypothetical protein